MNRPPTPVFLIIAAVTLLMLSAAAGPLLASHGTPEAGTPGAGTPGPGTPGAATPDAATPAVVIPAVARPVVDLVVEEASAATGVAADEIDVSHVEAREWPDSSLGCPEEGGFYAQVITPGYLIRLTVGDETTEYHTDATGENIAVCEAES